MLKRARVIVSIHFFQRVTDWKLFKIIYYNFKNTCTVFSYLSNSMQAAIGQFCGSHSTVGLHTACMLDLKWVVPENIHTPPTEGICPVTPHPSGNSNLASYIALNFWLFQTPPPPWNFQSLVWGEYGYFLEPYNTILSLD